MTTRIVFTSIACARCDSKPIEFCGPAALAMGLRNLRARGWLLMTAFAVCDECVAAEGLAGQLAASIADVRARKAGR